MHNLNALPRAISLSFREVAGWLYCLRLSKRFCGDNELARMFNNRDVYIIGSGPSLDVADLTAIKHSTVLLLNRSISRWSELQDSNHIFWLCADNAASYELGPKIPFDIKKILSVSNFRRTEHLGQVLRRGDYFFCPACSFFRSNSRQKFSRNFLAPKRPRSLKDFRFSLRQRFCLPAHTVTLFAIMLSLGLEAKQIRVVGFDLQGGYSRNLSDIHDRHGHVDRSQVFDQEKMCDIDESLRCLKRIADERNIYITSNALDAREKVLPKETFLPTPV